MVPSVRNENFTRAIFCHIRLDSLFHREISPDPQNIFPVSLRRELCEKSCGTVISCFEIVSLGPEIAEFPVKFPVSREFPWRRVRSPLRRQGGSSSSRYLPDLHLSCNVLIPLGLKGTEFTAKPLS